MSIKQGRVNGGEEIVEKEHLDDFKSDDVGVDVAVVVVFALTVANVAFWNKLYSLEYNR